MLRQASRRKYHYIYKTTCNVTGKYYIGMHSTDNLEDGYVGSGKRLWYSINRHGKENHVCEILEFLPDRKALKAREAELLCEEKLTDPLCMNLKVGGEGGFDHISLTSDELKTRQRNGGKEYHRKLKENPERYLDFIKKSTDKVDKINREGKAVQFSKDSNHKVLAQTVEAKAKRKKSLAAIKHQQGEKNSQYGTCWINNSIEVKKIKNDQVDDYLKTGWKLGRSLK